MRVDLGDGAGDALGEEEDEAAVRVVQACGMRQRDSTFLSRAVAGRAEEGE